MATRSTRSASSIPPPGQSGHPEVHYNATTQLPLPAGLLPHIPDPSALGAAADPGNSDGPSSSSLPISPRIIGGTVTGSDRFPFVASLLDTGTMAHICGGTLVAPDVVLTAGHCSSYFDSIQVGRHDIVNGKPRTYDHLVVEEHVTHPSYGNVIMHDFALAKLYGTSGVKPVRMNNRRNVPAVDEALTVMGWGVTEEGDSSTASDVLREVDVISMSNEECEKSSGEYGGEQVSYNGYIVKSMMCAWMEGVDACQGDSGGPIIKARVEGGGGGWQEDVQVGIVSWGLGCAHGSFPGVYARLSAVDDWLRNSICRMSADPPAYLGCAENGNAPAFEWLSRTESLAQVTVAIELDDEPRDTSWVLEGDRGVRSDVSRSVDGASHVPFDTYSTPLTVVTQVAQVTPGEQYRLTLLDRGSDGLKPKADGQQRQSRFRLCHGSVAGDECINAQMGSDLVICSGNGNFNLAKSISCFVDRKETPAPTPDPTPVPEPLVLAGLIKPPTFAPVTLLLAYGDDDRMRPTPRPTGVPSSSPTTAEPTRRPVTMAPITPTPILIGTHTPTKEVPTAFLAGTFGTKATKEPTAPPVRLTVATTTAMTTTVPIVEVERNVSNDVAGLDVPLVTGAEGATSSSFERYCAAWSMAGVAILTVYLSVL